MSERRAPAWLGELQARFGEMLRTPLDRSTGQLRALPEHYPERLLREVRAGAGTSAGERLAVYNRQYWFRLLSVLHGAYPLTTRLLGHWHFNQHAARFLASVRPTTELADLGLGFAEFLSQHAMPEAIIEAARVDRAYQRVARAPWLAPYRPGPADAQRLLTSRLEPSAALAIVREHWPLCELRRSLLAGADASEAPVPLPARLATAQLWLVLRDSEQLSSLALEPLEAELLELLSAHPVGEALALLEERCPENQRAALATQAQRWLARSVERGFWSALA